MSDVGESAKRGASDAYEGAQGFFEDHPIIYQLFLILTLRCRLP